MKKGDLKEQEVLEFIKKYSQNNGIAPTYREISKGVNIKSTNSVKKYVDRLFEKNLLSKQRTWLQIQLFNSYYLHLELFMLIGVMAAV